MAGVSIRGISAVLACALVATTAHSATIRVDHAGSGDYVYIGDAVAAAEEGDTVLVAPGIYTERDNINIDFEGTNISLLSEAGAESTILFCAYINRGFRFRNGEDSTSVVRGFTVSRGQAALGGAILMEGNVRPRVSDCVFEFNIATDQGGGAYISGGVAVFRNCRFVANECLSGVEPKGGGVACASYARPVFVDCDFIENEADNSGGGIYSSLSEPEFVRCNIRGNRAFKGGGAFCDIGSNAVFTDCAFTNNYGYWGGGFLAEYSPTLLEDCLFIDNSAGSRGGGARFHSVHSADVAGCTFAGNTAGDNGGAMEYIYGSSGTVSNCTIVDNAATGGGSGVYCQGSNPIVENSIVAFNTHGKGISCNASEMPSITHCIVFANQEGDSLCGDYHTNEFVDPLFCNIGAYNFTLCANSPCLTENNDWSEQVGAHDKGCGDCSAAIVRSSWGWVKSVFRDFANVPSR
jgi:hypothetical protein